MICHDDDVETAVQAYLLEAVHKLTHYLIHTLECFNQLQETGETNKHAHSTAGKISWKHLPGMWVVVILGLAHARKQMAMIEGVSESEAGTVQK